jgi:hypothetical protein
LNDIEINNNASAVNIDYVEDVRRFINSKVPVTVDSDDSWLLHLLAIFYGNFPGEPDDSRDD